MDIKTYVNTRKVMLKEAVSSLNRKPVLVIIQVNENSASDKYIAGKIKDSEEVGIKTQLIKLSLTTSEEALITLIKKLNSDKEVDGLIVQLPLPPAINEDHIKLAVDPLKDVDGFHPLSLYKPCTPLGIINYLKSENIPISGKNAVVVGRSNIVGKPMAKLLLQEDASVTIVHSKTPTVNMNGFLANADIIVLAVGKQIFLSNQQLKPTAVVVDVGINVDSEGKLHGDAAPSLNVALQTPVPGGVGLLTRVTLLENVLEAYKNGI